ncbi:hypothetical protein K439DRAFT_1641712 [Ramaria rubella]|nr:hypothetical protein K439DRAFT_1641712 [Ramaria rubella]
MAQVAYSKLFFRDLWIPLPPLRTRMHFRAFKPQSATLRVAALPAEGTNTFACAEQYSALPLDLSLIAKSGYSALLSTCSSPLQY